MGCVGGGTSTVGESEIRWEEAFASAVVGGGEGVISMAGDCEVKERKGGGWGGKGVGGVGDLKAHAYGEESCTKDRVELVGEEVGVGIVNVSEKGIDRC